MHLDKLLSLSSPALRDGEVLLSPRLRSLAGEYANDFSALLARRNGFYAFESALHVLPSAAIGSEVGMENWNAGDGWRSCYGGMADAGLFFAEDVFGGQFCITKDGICTFDPET